MNGSAESAPDGAVTVDDRAAISRETELALARELGQSERTREVLQLEAPYLIEKLLGARLVESAEQGRRLFAEVKKYLLLGQHLSRPLPMSSALVDAAWHQFVLFTREYDSFCRSWLGVFFHHAPTLTVGGDGLSGASHDEFVALYEAAFGALPDVWYDSRCLRAETLLRRFHLGDRFEVSCEGERALLYRERQRRELVCRASLRALPALEFLAREDGFLLRELPGLRTLDERLALCRPLVRYEVLRLCV